MGSVSIKVVGRQDTFFTKNVLNESTEGVPSIPCGAQMAVRDVNIASGRCCCLRDLR